MTLTTKTLNENQLTKQLNLEQLRKGPTTSSPISGESLLQLNSGGTIDNRFASMFKGKHFKSVSTEPTQKRTNPYEPQPWENNTSVSKLTDEFAAAIPTLGEVVQASMMMSTPNPFAIRYGQKMGNDFGSILMQLQANRAQRDNELKGYLEDQRMHDFEIEKFKYQQQKDALTIIRDQAKQGNEAVGEVYRQMMQVLPRLDEGSANSLINNIINDPRQVEGLQDAQDAYKFMFDNMEKSGIKWQEKRGGKGKAKVAVNPLPKLKSSSVKTVNVDGQDKIVSVQTQTDGTVRMLDVQSGQPVTGNVTPTVSKPKEKEDNSFAALAQKIQGAESQNKEVYGPNKPKDLPIEVIQPGGNSMVKKLFGLFK